MMVIKWEKHLHSIILTIHIYFYTVLRIILVQLMKGN